jgi:PLP dependent protein
MAIKNNIAFYQEQARTSGARLIVVSKTQPPEKIGEAYEAGQRLFGENKVQELCSKADLLPKDIQWHMIGHLQSNKVKFIAPFVALIHSVDSFKLLEEINKQGQKVNRIIPCLLQVYIAKEETKFGLDEAEVRSLLDSKALLQLANVQVDGLMGMASFTDRVEQVRDEFKSLKSLFTSLSVQPLPTHVRMKELSMGMSADYITALEEGSTLIRIGTAIFGERKPK